MISESVCISYQGKNITLDYTNLYDKFMREVRKVNKGEDFETWKKEEKTTYLSAVISKEIDNIHTVSGVKISNKDKDLIFDSAHRYIDDENLKLDTSCAQSSIKHCIRTYLNGENQINDFFEKESKEKNKIVSEIVNSISNHIYENIFGEGNGLIEKRL
ncbi:hypothetical protein [Yersinia hibernica]|uniref:Uncharacterized protein n=1 Tax=Yersinia enterocolitica LC20 TaxID=1443113 RepID=A0A7U4K1M6_YEREN|nr:hypothetical protein [Yersinia hibernica]AHM74312.2 hypothetical protein LC20_03059 [Yersinia hibernica]